MPCLSIALIRILVCGTNNFAVTCHWCQLYDCLYLWCCQNLFVHSSILNVYSNNSVVLQIASFIPVLFQIASFQCLVRLEPWWSHAVANKIIFWGLIKFFAWLCQQVYYLWPTRLDSIFPMTSSLCRGKTKVC